MKNRTAHRHTPLVQRIEIPWDFQVSDPVSQTAMDKLDESLAEAVEYGVGPARVFEVIEHKEIQVGPHTTVVRTRRLYTNHVLPNQQVVSIRRFG